MAEGKWHPRGIWLFYRKLALQRTEGQPADGQSEPATESEWGPGLLTEKEWLASVDPAEMLEFTRFVGSRRKLGLFAAACYRRISDLTTDRTSLSGVEFTERYLEGAMTDSALWYFNALRRVLDAAPIHSTGQCHGEWVKRLMVHGAAYDLLGIAAGLEDGIDNAVSVIFSAAQAIRADDADSARLEAEAIWQCDVVRDIFGPYPFRPVPIDPVWFSWNYGYIHDFARRIYERRAFDFLPQLGQALKDAGCTDQDILNHCQQPVVHVQGCWVLDLLLGNE